MRVDLYAVLVAPLLTFLSDALVHHDDTVIAQSADDGLRDAATRGDLRHTRLMGDGVDDISRGGLSEFLARYDGDRGGRVLQFGIARYARHHQFVQFQVTVEYIGRVRRMLMVVMMLMVLSCRCCTYPQQRQDEI